MTSTDIESKIHINGVHTKGKLTTDGNLEDDLSKEFDNQSTSMAPTRNGSVSDAKIQDSIKCKSQIPKSLRNLGVAKRAT
jgi:hypothetical protein